MELIFLLVVALVLFAVLIGALMPLIFQAKRTLGAAEKQLDQVGDHADALIRDVNELVGRVNAMSDDVARVVKRVDLLTEGAEDAGPSVVQITESLRGMAETVDHLRQRLDGAAGLSMSIVPAAVAGFQQWMAHREAQQHAAEGAPRQGPMPPAPPPDSEAYEQPHSMHEPGADVDPTSTGYF